MCTLGVVARTEVRHSFQTVLSGTTVTSDDPTSRQGPLGQEVGRVTATNDEDKPTVRQTASLAVLLESIL